jgi:tetratricopeptide (TPR) repeat protein
MLLAFLLLIGFSVELKAQSDALVDRGKTAQAKSEEEFDKYLEIVTAADPRQVVVEVDAFVSQFPHSELLSAAYQSKMHACEQLNDFDGMLAAGREALLRNPDDANTLLALAPAMASRAAGRTDRNELLTQAGYDAHHALEEIESKRISRQVSLQEWALHKGQMESEAHGVLGIVALQRNQSASAVREFKTSISLAAQPQGIQFLRLGLALSSSGAKSEAQENLRRAAELGPDAVRRSASEELKKLSQPVAPR